MQTGNFIRLTKDLSFADLKNGEINKIEVYTYIVKTWILNPIDLLMKDPINTDNGMAILALELMFFEPHGEYLTGNGKLGSKIKFCKAFDEFVKYLKGNKLVSDKLVSLSSESIYKWARCGLFHAGRLSDELLVDAVNSSKYSLSINPIMPGWLVNPWRMRSQIEMYLEHYSKELSKSNNGYLLDNFNRTFKRMIEDPMEKFCSIT